MELEPQLREVLQCFYDSRYGHCLKLLEDMKDNLLLDLYLAPHIQTLFSMIRLKREICIGSSSLTDGRHGLFIHKLYKGRIHMSCTLSLQLNMFRNRGLVQYFSPYISADLAKMAVSFNTTIPNLVRKVCTEKSDLIIVSVRKTS